MEIQNELFPLPKKQKSLFGKAKGTVLGESPMNSRQSFSRTSEGRSGKIRSPQTVDESKPAEIEESNRALKPRYHRCDPSNPVTRRFGGDKAKRSPWIEKLEDEADAFNDEILEETLEGEPLTDQPLPVIEEEEPIQLLGQVTHLDSAHENPYEQNESLWQLTRQFFQRYFGI